MKTLIVYYSFEGNTRFIAQEMAQAVGADLLELTPKDQRKVAGMMKYAWGGLQVMMKKRPELVPFNIQWDTYALIVVGTPVWAWTYAPALATFFSTVRLQGKKIALFCCHGGGKGKTLEHMHVKFAGNDVIGKIDFVEPLSYEKTVNGETAKKWIRDMAGSVK